MCGCSSERENRDRVDSCDVAIGVRIDGQTYPLPGPQQSKSTRIERVSPEVQQPTVVEDHAAATVDFVERPDRRLQLFQLGHPLSLETASSSEALDRRGSPRPDPVPDRVPQVAEGVDVSTSTCSRLRPLDSSLRFVGGP